MCSEHRESNMLKFVVLILFIQSELFIQCFGEFYVTTIVRSPDDVKEKIDLLDAKIDKILKHLGINSTDSVKKYPRNCKEVQEKGSDKSDVYYIQPEFAPKPFPVMCNMNTTGGGWTYIMNRYDGSEDFYQGWDSYKDGFGNVGKEFWLGLEKIHLLTGFSHNELLIEMVDWENHKANARYHTFTVGSEEEGYILKILEGYSGDAGESIFVNAGMKFTTKDKDQDLWFEKHGDHNCAHWSKGAWWYRECKQANPTGKYYQSSRQDDFTGMYWSTFHGDRYSLKQMRMMVRPRGGHIKTLQPKENFE